MAGCVVPGCTNRTVRWLARVPEDDQLRASWRAAILGGTGRRLSEAQLDGRHVCQLHFPAHQQPERGQMYREPTLFLVDRTWCEVSCCQLCLEYKPVERMFNRKYCLKQSYSLQSLAYKYFRVRQFIKSTTQESYFCESCVIRIDITHRFCEQINDNARAYERILRKMSKTLVVFDQSGPGGNESGEEGDDRRRGHSFRQCVIKEESQIERETGDSNTASGQLKSEPDCEIEEHQFETIEVDDEEDEATIQIKVEPDMEEMPVNIKQEVPDEEDPPQPESNLPVKVKEEPPEEEVESPAKKLRLEFKYGCLMCKEFFKSQDALNQHLKDVVHEKFLEHKCISCGISVLPRQGKKPMCGKCEGFSCEEDSTASPKILNKQLAQKPCATYFACKNCNRNFTSKEFLTFHLGQENCKKPIYSCSQCEELFRNDKELIAHVEVVHMAPRRGKKCAMCGEWISAVLYELHKLLLCGVDLPKPDETRLRNCALLFFRQKHHRTKAFNMLQSRFGQLIPVSSSTVDAWYVKFMQGDFMFNDAVQANIQQLIDENATISLQELSEQVEVDLNTVRLRTGLTGLMQKNGRWVPQELHVSQLKNRLNFCRALLARYKDSTALDDMILCSERWVYYGNSGHHFIRATKDSTVKKVLLCVWWDQRGLIFHELLEPQQAAARDRYQAQFTRFTKAMQSARLKVPRQVCFQYGVTDPAARQELKTILSGIGWEMLRHPVHSPDIDPTDYHVFQLMQYGFQNLYFANVGQLYEWVAKVCKEQAPNFFLRGIRMLLQRWKKVVELKGDYCGQ
uniref:Putative transposase n=1 Tax=Culex tarsalis TaxID=7177 RepID=A0A1Q3EUR0_CULTA